MIRLLALACIILGLAGCGSVVPARVQYAEYPKTADGIVASEANLIATVRHLSEEIGIRSYRDISRLNTAADFIEREMRLSGCDVKRQTFDYRGGTYYNIIGEVKGTNLAKQEILIVGAHYDTTPVTPGADDNASGIAGLLELARLTAQQPAERTIRFVAFSLEERPVFGTEDMGSHVYAKSVAEEKVKVLGMLSLEMIGYFCVQKGCQKYPFVLGWFFPDTGDYISFVGNPSSRSFTKKVKKLFEAQSTLPVERLNTFASGLGVDLSDHLNFWKFGFDAFMITDTSKYRNPHYHEAEDTWGKLDYKRMRDVVNGIYAALRSL